MGCSNRASRSFRSRSRRRAWRVRCGTCSIHRRPARSGNSLSLSKPATRSPPDARTGGRHLTRLRDSASTGKATSWSGCRRSFSDFVGRAGRRRQRCGGGQAETARPPRARWRPSSAALTGSASATTRSGGTKPSTSACPQVCTKRPRGPTAALLPIRYPGHYEVRRVSRNGGIRWGSRWVNVSHVLAKLDVGFEEIDDGLFEVYFGPVWLGRLHETTCRIVDHLGRAARRDGGHHKAKVLPIS